MPIATEVNGISSSSTNTKSTFWEVSAAEFTTNSLPEVEAITDQLFLNFARKLEQKRIAIFSVKSRQIHMKNTEETDKNRQASNEAEGGYCNQVFHP